MEFTDEAGAKIQLAEYFGQKPVILMFVYHECPMLCSSELNGLVTCLRAMSYTAGKDFTLVTVSFNPSDSVEIAARKKAEYVRSYNRSGAAPGWHFLTGGQTTIQNLAKTVGFRYQYDPATKLFAHPAGIVLLTPQGRISRYYYGVEYYPRDLNLGLVEASNGKIGTFTDQALLYCYRYDPMTGRYGLVILNLLRAGGALTAGGLTAYVAFMIKRERKKERILNRQQRV
ncbi:MAG TPA: SCO family protein [Planctomycetota bacterium]|nr:SCO family protein [Planctomycetota bacterium]